MRTLLRLTLFLLVAAPAVAGQPGTVKLKREYRKLIRTCEQIYLPNSMALAKGVDKDKRRAKLEKRRLETIAKFRSDDGIRYLEEQLRSVTDDLDRQCINFSLTEARGEAHPEGQWWRRRSAKVPA